MNEPGYFEVGFDENLIKNFCNISYEKHSINLRTLINL